MGNNLSSPCLQVPRPRCSPQSIVFESRGARRKAPGGSSRKRHPMDRESLGESYTHLILAPVAAPVASVHKKYYHSMHFYFFSIGREPTTSPANDCLLIMVCSCVVPSKRVLLQIIFCSCVIGTTFSR